MLSLEEREERRKQLGASEIHKIFNFDSRDCQELWELKVGLRDYEEIDNDAITAGNILEEPCLDYYEKVNNVCLIRNERIEHPRIKGLVASFDAREEQTLIPVENKAINQSSFEKWIAKRTYNATYEDLKLNIPQSYYLQCQLQMAISDTNKAVLNLNTLTDDEQENPLNVVITDLHNKQITIQRSDSTIEEIEKRASYMLHCMKYKRRPSEKEYFEKYVLEV